MLRESGQGRSITTKCSSKISITFKLATVRWRAITKQFFALAYFVAFAHANVDDEKTLAIAKQNACLGCHAINKKIVGPSFQAVAEKYKSDPNAQAFLKNKIAKGGSGSWGVVPMPANTKLSNADLNALTGWILRGAPSAN